MEKEKIKIKRKEKGNRDGKSYLLGLPVRVEN